ncbi:GTPase Era, mitochondrial-like [Limulus polyphemus]|uniref:GTPase Era, mitochondrial n=1 Tax=Limulus polyphemus TaxID=6850 RepID=A0ABM1TPH9_LIMPO|nr:GTPase Era, mitochondrial-like [Limulus polyphemus]XP_013789809.1 GTPase Era, mitochondrial-like [Limulus polyphemus]XP_022257785.1 GTPase Era, mitochondrial-like [Limulus polyphemus]
MVLVGEIVAGLQKCSRTLFYCTNRKGLKLLHRFNVNFSSKAATEKSVPNTLDEYKDQLRCSPVQPNDPRLLKVSILGEPNAGKSTLTNSLLGWRVCSVSRKVHTTRRNTAAVLTEGNTQIVFLDTPGLVTPDHGKKHHLDSTLTTGPSKSVQHADTILVVVDVSNKWTRNHLDPGILKLLHRYPNKDCVLVLNKIDLLQSKQKLLEVSRSLTMGKVGGKDMPAFPSRRKNQKISLNSLFKVTEDKLEENNKVDTETGWPNFSRVFMISALDGNGVADLKTYFLETAHPSSWLYHCSMVTDQSPLEVVQMAVREKILEYLPKEIPYNLNLDIEMWEVDDAGVLKVAMSVICPRRGLVKILIGHRGRMISRIAEEAKQAVANTFHCDVSLKLIVKYKEDQ